MRQDAVLRHEFTEFIPDQLKSDTLYISIRFATASHLCVCGCGNKVVTPIRPTDWKLIFDGKTVSLDPSIGNWNFPCESHYWIRNNRIRWAPKWSRERIESGREYDEYAKEKYFAAVTPQTPSADAAPQPASAESPRELRDKQRVDEGMERAQTTTKKLAGKVQRQLEKYSKEAAKLLTKKSGGR